MWDFDWDYLNSVWVGVRVNPGAVTFRTAGVPNPPVSGTGYQNTLPLPLTLVLEVELTPTSSTASSAAGSISPSDSGWIAYPGVLLPAGAQASSGATTPLLLEVPPGWWYMFTATNASFVSMIGFG